MSAQLPSLAGFETYVLRNKRWFKRLVDRDEHGLFAPKLDDTLCGDGDIIVLGHSYGGLAVKLANALVDYDNVRDSKESGVGDVSINLSLMIPRLTYKIQSIVPDVEEIRYRLYGGWSLRDGQHSSQCGWLLGELFKVNIRHGLVRAKCSLARELVSRPDLYIFGTYRDGGQKMVDEMITSDLIELSHDLSRTLVLVSDDDDFVPGIIMSSAQRHKKEPVIVLRPARKTDKPINDHLLEQCHVSLSAL